MSLSHTRSTTDETHLNVSVAIIAVPRNSSLVRSVRRGSTGTTDLDLCAFSIELRIVCLVEGDQLVADEVVARGEALGNRASPSLVAPNELGDIPARRRLSVEEYLDAVTVETSLIDLEPAATRAIAGAEGTRALVHPDNDRSLAVCPLLPDSGDAIAGVR